MNLSGVGQKQGLSLAAWPDVDRDLWEGAFAPRSILDEVGSGVGLAVNTRRRLATSYAFWLRWLAETRADELQRPPAVRPTPAMLVAYVDHLVSRVSVASAVLHLRGLQTAFRLLAPEIDWKWVGDIACRLDQRRPPRPNKRARLTAPAEVTAVAIKMIDEALSADSMTAYERAIQLRDGLIIAMLAARPLRRSAMAGLIVGDTFRAQGERYLACIPPTQSKTNIHLEFTLPTNLECYMRHYLAVDRHVLARRPGRRGPRPPSGSFLWLANDGSPMTPNALYKMVVRRMHHLFGKHQTPHLFRDAAATWIAILSPEQVRMTRSILGHSQLRTSERHYNHAHMMEAGRRFQGVIEKLREG